MLTVICETPGTLKAEQRDRPVRAEGQVLVRVKRVGVCGTDLHIFTGNQPFLDYPRVMGHELSGVVEEAAPGGRLAVGDVVYVMPYLSCGHCVACRQGKTNCCVNIQVLGVHRDGAFTGVAADLGAEFGDVGDADDFQDGVEIYLTDAGFIGQITE